MRVAILTTEVRQFASLCLPRLVAAGHEAALVVLDSGGGRARRALGRKLGKLWRIGPLGALNGVRMRSWYGPRVAERLALEDLDTICRREGVALARVDGLNDETTRARVRAAAPDVGLALGCGWIGPKLFSIPRHGTLNVHHEVLPRYRGASAVIWQIHDGSPVTGYTIHRVERAIDAGTILHAETVPIEFREDLAETTVHNYARLLESSARRLVALLDDLPAALAAARPQTGPAGSYTTPTFRQYRRMVREHRRLAAAGRP